MGTAPPPAESPAFDQDEDDGPDASGPAGEDDTLDSVLRSPFARPRIGALRNVLTTLFVGALIVGAVWFLDRPGTGGASQQVNVTVAASGPAPRVGQPAPDFQVQGLDGRSFRLSDFRGRPVWVTFWATWCPPCRAENPDIEAVYEAKRDQGLVILALSLGEDAETVRGYVQRTGLTYTVGLDQATEIAAAYRIVGIPTHFFVDRDGIVRAWRIGSLSKQGMEQRVNQILAPTGAQPTR